MNTQTLARLPDVDECALWLVDLDAADPPGLQALSQEERARAARFVFERDRVRFAAGRAALRFLLGSVLDRDPATLVLAAGAQGKPHLQDASAPGFNLSHSGGLALIAIDSPRGRQVGVDIELRRQVPDALALARTCFDEEELDALQAHDDASQGDAFLRGWTRKEACIKATGTGFSGGAIPSTGIAASPRQVALPDGRTASLASLALPDAIAALAALALIVPADAYGAPASPHSSP